MKGSYLMAPKIKISYEDIINGAINIVREQGWKP